MTGFFRDSDLIRVINREGILIAAGGAASLLQTAHPQVAQGVYDHSYTHDDPMRRLRNTMGWVYTVTWGTEAEAEQISAIVRKMHDDVTGPGYAANDPELQAWVAATLFAVGTQFYQQIFRCELTEAQLEEFYQQNKILATILGCPDEQLPADYREFRGYYAEMLRTIEISEASKLVAEQVLNPKLPFFFEPGLKVIRLLTAGMMPAPIREQYGWAWSPARERRFRLLVTLMSLVYPRLPTRVRVLPRDVYLFGTRKMLAKQSTAKPKFSVRSAA